MRTGSIARTLCRDAARVQEHPSDTRRSRTVHAPKSTTSWRLRGACSWAVIEACHASAAMVYGPRLPGHRVRSYPVLPAVRRCSVDNPARGRRPLTQGHHRGHHEVAGELGLRKDHHQRDVNYCTEKAASIMVNDRRFVDDDAYEIEMNKKTVTYTLPVHVGFFVLQYAKMCMLQFYYDFINMHLERPLFQY